ncbi:MAG TPA: signal peptidase I [Terriglobia bacterium]|nr:signal peptidase I [Terriglobia bacterium]
MSTEPEVDQVPKVGTETKALPGVLSEIRWWVRDIFFAVGTAIMIVIFLYQPVKVEGTSMLPELRDQERIFVNKFVYRIEEINRKDIVVFWYPRDPTKSYIKRIIGMPGDTVEIKGSNVFINEQLLTEPYVDPNFFDDRTYPAVIVEPGHYFVLGDHRNQSNDSRMWGMVPARYIYGKAVFRYWPMSKIGSLD